MLRKGSWSLDKPKIPVFDRQKLSHNIIDNSTFSNSASFDDEVAFNTQSGSQWDGLRHAIYREQGLLYNGVKKGEVIGSKSTDVLGLNSKFHWHQFLILVQSSRSAEFKLQTFQIPFRSTNTSQNGTREVASLAVGFL